MISSEAIEFIDKLNSLEILFGVYLSFSIILFIIFVFLTIFCIMSVVERDWSFLKIAFPVDLIMFLAFVIYVYFTVEKYNEIGLLIKSMYNYNFNKEECKYLFDKLDLDKVNYRDFMYVKCMNK